MTAEDLFIQAEGYRLAVSLPEAIETYYAAESAGFDPCKCGAARWTCYMLAGRWEQAWLESDRIDKYGVPDPNRFWDGSDWAGKDVLIRCLHGLGDTLQFIRYAPLVRGRARSVTIEAQPKLKSLLQRAKLADHVITWGEPEPAWQVQVEVNELPRIFRTVPATIPNGTPYLLPSNRETEFRHPSPGKHLKVGLIWAASDFDTSRNIPFRLLRPLLNVSELTFFSLQAGEGWTPSLPEGVVSLTEEDTNIERLADEMMGLDLVLTVDTMNAHLAGGLGRTTWTMLPFQCDWRWMTEREDTPWYPAMRLFRQPRPGDWESVIEDVRAALLVKLHETMLHQRAR